MTVRIVSEPEFRVRLAEVLRSLPPVGSVTGPGRSGAVAAVYASHLLGVPFIPYGSRCPVHLGRLLVIDTAKESGATLRKAERRYREADLVVVACYEEPPRVMFWYEGAKPQRYRHERVACGREPWGPVNLRNRYHSVLRTRCAALPTPALAGCKTPRYSERWSMCSRRQVDAKQPSRSAEAFLFDFRQEDRNRHQ